jgi:uncharacterized membrane protein YbhN (UPF0104 family)
VNWRRRARQVIRPVLGLLLFAAALWVLSRELGPEGLSRVPDELRRLPPTRLGLSLLATVAGYAALAWHDLLALRALGRPMPYRRIAITAFEAWALANNLPLAFVVGGAVRYRRYTTWGLPAGTAAAVVGYNAGTYALGLLTAAAVAFTVEPEAVPGLLRLPFRSTRPLGLFALALVLGYLAWSVRGRPRVRLFGRSFGPLGARMTLAQTAVSLLDWTLSCAALYLLLPKGQPLSFAGFFGVFVLAQIAALLTQLPGGLGVFEAVVVAMLSPTIPVATALSALIAYRMVYYVLPLLAAVTLLGAAQLPRLGARRPPAARSPEPENRG